MKDPGIWLFDLRLVRMIRRPRVVPDARDLPTHLHARFATPNKKAIPFDLDGDVKEGGWSTDRRQLIAKVAVQCFEVFRELDPARPSSSNSIEPL